MPAGVSWGQYTKFFVAAMLSMLAGSQIVHTYYKPLDDLETYIQKELAAHGRDAASLPKNNSTATVPDKLSKAST